MIIENAIQTITKKQGKIYFFIPETGEVPSASINHLLNVAIELKNDGYDPVLLTQEETYNIPTWLPKQYGYSSLPKISLKTKGLKIGVEDLVVVSELYIELVKEMVKNRFPCKIIMFVQRYHFMFDFLNIGEHWKHSFGIDEVITTSEEMKKYVEGTMTAIDNIQIISPFVDDFFKKPEIPQKPIISLICRETGDAEKIYKIFYNKYPHYRWITFNLIKTTYKERFAEELAKSCLAVWVDEHSSFGTFPLEAMKCGVPVIGEVPKLIPDWMVNKNSDNNITGFKNNGIWVTSKITIPDQIALFLNSWVTENLGDTLYSEMETTANEYNIVAFKKQVQQTFQNIFNRRVEALNKIITEEAEKEQENEKK